METVKELFRMIKEQVQSSEELQKRYNINVLEQLAGEYECSFLIKRRMEIAAGEMNEVANWQGVELLKWTLDIHDECKRIAEGDNSLHRADDLFEAIKAGRVDHVEGWLMFRGLKGLYETFGLDRRTPLMEAALANQLEVAKVLLKHDPQAQQKLAHKAAPPPPFTGWDGHRGPQLGPPVGLNAMDRCESTALGLACQEGHVEMVQLLLDHGALPFVTEVESYREHSHHADAMFKACWNGQIGAVKVLLANLESLRTPKWWQNCATAACSGGQEAVLQMLLEDGPDPATALDFRPLVKLAMTSGKAGVVRLLLSAMHKIDVNRTIFILTETLKDAMRTFKDGDANGDGHTEVVHVLLQHGAYMHNQNKECQRQPQGSTGHSLEYGYGDYAPYSDYLYRGDRVSFDHQWLQDTKAERNALVKAAREGDVSALEAMLGHLDPQARRLKLRGRDQSGHTPLTVAVEKGNEAMVERLIEWGAEVDVAHRDGMTPLKLAARMGRPSLIRRLCAAGAVMRDLEKPERKETCLHAETYDALACAADLETLTTLMDLGAPTRSRGVEVAFRTVCAKGDLPALRQLMQHTRDKPWYTTQGGHDALIEAMLDPWSQDLVIELLAAAGAAKPGGWYWALDDYEKKVVDASGRCPLALKLAQREDLYILYKARTIHNANSPQAPLPACLAQRAQPPQQPLSTVTVAAPTMPSESKGGACSEGGQGPRMEVLVATTAFVVQALTRDLYQELMLLLLPDIPPLAAPLPDHTTGACAQHRGAYVYSKGDCYGEDGEEYDDEFFDETLSDGSGY